MPTVPVIQTQVANVGGIGGYSAPQAAPVIDQRPQMIQQAGQAMSQSAEQWAQLEAQRRRRADIAANSERAAALGEQDIEADAAYGRLEGKAAYEGFQGYVESRDKRYKAALESAPEGPQREWLRQHLAQERQRFYNSAVVHREKQTFVWRKASATAEATTAQQKAVSMWASPDAESLVAEARDKWGEIADMDGLDDKAKQQFVSANMSNLHAQTLDVMLNEQRLGQATKYFQDNGAEIDPVAKSRIGAKIKAQAVEETARAIDADPNLRTIASRMQAVDRMVTGDPAKVMSSEDEQKMRRLLMQFEEQRQTQLAIQGQEARKEAEQFLAQNPHLTVAELPSDLLERVRNFGVQVKRAVSNPEFKAAMRTEEGMRRLRMMSPERLAFELQNNLTPSDASDAEKLVIGDQTGYTINQLTRALAIESGVIPAQSARGQAGIDDQALLSWERNTIAPLVDAARTKLGRPLNVREFEELIRPLQEDKVWKKATTFGVDAWGSDEEMTVLKAQSLNEGGLPIDNPATRDVDESLDIRNNDFYVKVDGEEVRLASIPMFERRRIRDDYKAEWIARHGSADGMPIMPVVEEARAWLARGKPGIKPPPSQVERMPESMPHGIMPGLMPGPR